MTTNTCFSGSNVINGSLMLLILERFLTLYPCIQKGKQILDFNGWKVQEIDTEMEGAMYKALKSQTHC